MNQYIVADLVADFLKAVDATTLFGVVSVHNIPILDAVARCPGLRFVMARGELGAGHMADGHARASGKLGVVVSSTGPGAANAVTGLMEARFANAPVLHITGQTATGWLERGLGTVHEVPDQLGMLRSVSKAAYRVRNAADALGTLKRAVLEAHSAPAGPVSVEIPIDIQRAPIARPAPQDLIVSHPAPAAPSRAELARLIERVRAARRPLLWVGSGARGAGVALTELLAMGFGMVTSWAARGVVSDAHPRNLGALNGWGIAEVEALYREADLMLVAGSRLRYQETGDAALKLPANLLRIDIDPAADGRGYANALFVQGDAAATLSALVDALRGHSEIDPAFTALVERTKPAAAEAYRRTLGPYASFAGQFAQVMPSDAVWARDITMSNSTWGHRLFPLADPRNNVYPVGGGIGQGMSLGIGAAFAGRPTVVLTGDGGFFLNVGELWTAVQERLDIVIIVMNDNGYCIIKHMQDANCDGRRNHADLLGPKLDALAALAGIGYQRVTRGEELGAAVKHALGTRGPTLVEVDMNAIGEFPPYFPHSRLIEQARARAKAAAGADAGRAG